MRVASAVVCALTLTAAAAEAASLHRLDVRERHQHRTAHKAAGTLRFFTNHPRAARTLEGRRAQRRARVWLRVARRELADTREERRDKLRARRSLQSAHTGGGSVTDVICQVFGPYCAQALAVARCESTLNVYATNGQYWGLFQEGDYARGRYGFAWDAWSQARSAYAYFRDAGWSPWTCA